MKKRLKVEGISVGYEKNDNVLKNVSFHVDEGDFFVLLGSSGCGKTTLLNVIAGLLDTKEGNIYIDGILANKIEPRKRNIAMVFQSYALYPTLTVYENIAFPLQNAHVPKKQIREKVNIIAKTLEIDNLLNRKPTKLSGGQMQRVAIARAMVREPKLYLMDEPLSNLDASLRDQMRQELKKLHRQLNATIIYVTHDQIEALSLADKIVILNLGKIQQIGTPYQVYNYPQNEFVASFLGTPKMNLIRGVDLMFENGKYHISILNSQFEIDEAVFIVANSKKVDVGIRPDDVIIQSTSESDSFKIVYKEFLGDSFLYRCESNDSKLLITIKSTDEFEEEAYVKLNFKDNKVHLFNCESGESLRK